MTDKAELFVSVRRHPTNRKTAAYRLYDVDGLHWSSSSGGVRRPHGHMTLYGYVLCDGAVEGEVDRSCRHGPPPHRMRVCLPKSCNKDAWKAILAAAPPKFIRPPMAAGQTGPDAKASQGSQGSQGSRKGQAAVPTWLWRLTRLLTSR